MGETTLQEKAYKSFIKVLNAETNKWKKDNHLTPNVFKTLKRSAELLRNQAKDVEMLSKQEEKLNEFIHFLILKNETGEGITTKIEGKLNTFKTEIIREQNRI